MLRQKAEQAVADLGAELAAMQARAQDAAAEARVRLQAERDTLSRQLAAAGVETEPAGESEGRRGDRGSRRFDAPHLVPQSLRLHFRPG